MEKRNEKEHVFVDYLSDDYVQRDIAAVSTPESGTTAANRHRRTQVPFSFISSQLWTVSAIIDCTSSERCFYATRKIIKKSIQANSIQSRTYLLVCVKHVVFVFCCLNLFLQLYSTKKTPGHTIPGVSCEKKITLGTCCSPPRLLHTLLFISFYVHHPLIDY